jgi:hypothetical protein
LTFQRKFFFFFCFFLVYWILNTSCRCFERATPSAVVAALDRWVVISWSLFVNLKCAHVWRCDAKICSICKFQGQSPFPAEASPPQIWSSPRSLLLLVSGPPKVTGGIMEKIGDMCTSSLKTPDKAAVGYRMYGESSHVSRICKCEGLWRSRQSDHAIK